MYIPSDSLLVVVYETVLEEPVEEMKVTLMLLVPTASWSLPTSNPDTEVAVVKRAKDC